MKPTVVQGVSPRAVPADGVVEWANREALPILRELRAAANFEAIVEFSNVETSGAPGVIWTSEEMPTTGIWLVEVRVVASTQAISTVCAGLVARRAFVSVAGALTALGSTDITRWRNPATWDLALDVNAAARTVTATGTDDGVASYWTGTARILEVFQ